MPSPPPNRALARLRTLPRFRSIGATWWEHEQTRAALRRSLRGPQRVVGPPLTIVLPVYTRPRNLALSAALALRTPGLTELRLAVNDPHLDAAALLDSATAADRRLVIERGAQRRGPVERYRSAARSTAARFVSLDDDLFASPALIRALADRLEREPERPHGLYGQLVDQRSGRYTQNLCRRGGVVHVLNRVYAFSAEHVARYAALLEQLAEPDPVAIDDDVVLSFCGAALPRVHDLGPWLDCPSETDAGVSRFGRRDAAPRRRALYSSLASAVGEPPPRDAFAEQPRWRRAPRRPLSAALYYGSGIGLAHAIVTSAR